MLGVEKFISWLKVAVCARFSAKDTRRNPRIWGSGSACDVSKQQVEGLDPEGHLNATVGWSEHPYSSFRFPELSQPI
jgi:hypothetical protein